MQQCVATVNAPSDEPDDRRITAYLSAQAGSEVSMAQLRQQLTSRLPEYMLPSYYVQVETWPLTPNGKIDREALPPPNTADAHQADAYVAPRTEVEKRMAMIWQDLLRTDRIGIHDNFFERGGHSLLAVRLINEVEDQFAMRLSLKTVFNAPTVLQLARAMGHDQGPCTIVPLHPGPSADAKPPLFCIWGIFIYQELARQLDADRPVYAIHVETELQTLAVGNGHQRTGTPSIPAMAEQYLEQIKTIQPTGPYYLAGSSVGGLLALEIAQQLRRAGQSTAMLALFDTFLPGAIRWRCLHWLRHHLVELVQTGPAAFLQRCRQRRAGRRNHERVVQHMDQKRQHAMRKAMQRYRIQPYPGRILLFRATDLDLRPGTVIRPDHGWHRVHPKELEAHDVPTGHIEMLKAPHVQLLADQMRKSM